MSLRGPPETCGCCGYATPISSRHGLYLCIHTGRLKRSRDPCDVPGAAMNQWSRR